MDLDRLKKLYKLASDNSNKNEAAVAALKFIQAIEQQDLNMSFYKGDAPPTREQIEQALREHYQTGYQKGRQDLINEIKQQQRSGRIPRSTTNVTTGTISNGTIYFGY